RRARGVRAAEPPDGARAEPRPCGTTRGGRLMLALLAALQLQAGAAAPPAPDSLPVVTLAEALRRATGLDPNYVAAIGQVDNAVWARRSAFSVLVLPSVNFNTDATHTNTPDFTFVHFHQVALEVTAQAHARSGLYTGAQLLAM